MPPRFHWPEYLLEAAGLGVFMASACFFGALLEDPFSAARTRWPELLADPFTRRVLMGLAMGGTALVIFYSPWASRSGAHINPAVTLTFWRLGRIRTRDAVAYAAAQFAGGAAGVVLAALALGDALAHPAVRYVVTVPGRDGVAVAALAEATICFAMMAAVLALSSRPSLERFTGLACATLLGLYITFESPLSGTSLNPARTFASAVVAGVWTDAWIYFVAPPLGMLAAAEIHARLDDAAGERCAGCRPGPAFPEPSPRSSS